MTPGWRLLIEAAEETSSAVLVLVTVPLLAGTLGGAAVTHLVRWLAVGGGTV